MFFFERLKKKNYFVRLSELLQMSTTTAFFNNLFYFLSKQLVFKKSLNYNYALM